MSYLIYQHLGLGDHFICNGLVREICEKYRTDNFELVTKPSHFKTINFMFRDVTNLKVISLKSGDFSLPENGQEVNDYSIVNHAPILRIGHGYEPLHLNFDKSFYAQFDVDFQKRWSSFKVERDLQAEKDLIKKLDIQGKYVFLHDDPARGMCVSRLIPKDVSVIKASTDISDNMFDYLSLIEGAAEVHCIESSFMFLIDSFPINVPLFAHRYARNYPARNTPTLKLDWNILT